MLDGEHRFLARAGSAARRASSCASCPRGPPKRRTIAAAQAAVDRAAARMTRSVELGDLRDLLARNLEHPRWDEVAERCLTCGNCTMVCPTCFCTSIEDVSDLAGGEAERVRRVGDLLLGRSLVPARRQRAASPGARATASG